MAESIMSKEAAVRVATFHRDEARTELMREHWQRVIDGLKK